MATQSPVERKTVNGNPELTRGRDGRDRSGGERPKKKGRGGGWAIDPLDPTGKTGGKWSEGLVQVIRIVFAYYGIGINVSLAVDRLSVESIGTL